MKHTRKVLSDMSIKKYLIAIPERTETVEIKWNKGSFPPAATNTITVYSNEIDGLELSSNEYLSKHNDARDEMDLSRVIIDPNEPFEIISKDNQLDDVLLKKLVGKELTYCIEYFVGSSGQLYERGSDFIQVNEPKITFTVITIEE